MEPLKGISIWEQLFPKPIAIEWKYLNKFDEGYVSVVNTISRDSPVFGGNALRLLNSDGVTEQKYRMFALNADALQKAHGARGRVPKLLTRGIYVGQPAVVEEFPPVVKGLEFDDYLRSLDPERRSVFYRSLTRLYADLANEGIIHKNPQGRNFAIGPDMKAGLIDFEVSWVDGSDNNVLPDKSEVEVGAIEGLMDYIFNTERKSPGYVAGVHHLQKDSKGMQELQQFADAARNLKAG